MRGTRDVAIAFRRPCLLFWLTLVMLALSTAFYDFHFDRIEARLDRIDHFRTGSSKAWTGPSKVWSVSSVACRAVAGSSRGTPP